MGGDSFTAPAFTGTEGSTSTMTTQDQNKKTLRHFQCRDYLWEIFEQMSGELECSTDYLINEAMRQYARSRNYGTSRRGSAPASGAPEPITQSPPAPATAIPSLRQGPSGRPLPAPPAPRVSRAPVPTPAMPVARPSQALPPVRTASSAHRAASLPPPVPPRSSASMPAMAAPGRPSMYVIFNGQKIPVAKDEFIIGRGSKSADLAIKDGNISRRHAAVVWHNGAYYLKDLGSTNGVEYQGRRFDTKRIDEGDIFRICDYELRFTYM
jgi:hypothetical protein